MADAVELKALGNQAFMKKDYSTAIKHFSDAIALDPNNHVLYSNRSACHASLRQLEEALSDGSKTIELKPDFWKGYTRKATPLYLMGDYQEAKETYLAGLKVDPSNVTLQKGVSDCDEAINASNVKPAMGGMGGMGGSNPFAGMNIFTPDTVNKIKADPALAPFLDDPSFVEKLNSVIANPANMEKYMKDEPRLMQVFVALMKDSLKGMGIGDPTAKAEPPKAEPKVEPKAEPKAEPPKAEPKAEPPKAEPEAPKHSEPEPMDIDIDKQKAEAAKALGNAAYSKKDFEKAIEHYSEAINYNKTNIVYYLNRAAVYLTKGDYEKCEAECDLAVEIGRTYKCDFTQIGKAFHRKGKALIKQKKYTEACAVLQKSLSEKRSADVLKDYQLAEKLKKKQDMEDYFDTDKSLEAKSRGNEFFQKHQFPDAVKEYTEAIKRNPKDAALYSNRAAAYTKLMAYTEALKDCDKCVEIDPKFIKGYSRRATVHFMMKDYHKAISAYENAMKIDPNHPDVIKGYSQTLQKIQETRGDKDRTDRALHDPEIQELLREDQVQSLLQLLKNDPAAAQRAIQTNPELNRKFRVLMNAGLV